MKFLSVPLFLILLSGCSSIDILQYTDEIKKENVCRLNEYKISHEIFSFPVKARATFLTLRRFLPHKILVFLNSRIPKNFLSYPEIPIVEVSIENADKTKEVFSYKGFDRKDDRYFEEIPSMIGYSRLEIITSGFSFEMEEAHFLKMIKASNVRLKVQHPERPLDIVLDEKDKLAFQTFLQSCQ